MRILFDLRSDCRQLYHKLDDLGHEMVPFDPRPPLQEEAVTEVRPVYNFNGRRIEVDMGPPLGPHRTAIRSAELFLDALSPKPDACILWNTALPIHAGLALACRTRSIPVYEINHNRLETPLVGHFETHSLADYLVCSQHAAKHRRAASCSAYLLEFGQPAYDDWEPVDAEVARKAGGLDVEGPVILKTSTWVHPYSFWSESRFHTAHEAAMLSVLPVLFQKRPFDLLVTARGRLQPAQREALAQMWVQAGLPADRIFVTDDTPIKDCVDMADLVVSQRSGVAVDAVMSHRPAIMADFRPQFALRAEPPITKATNQQGLFDLADELLGQPARKPEWYEQFRAYWGGTNTAAEDLVWHLQEKVQ